MKKESIVAIVLGIGFGLVVAFVMIGVIRQSTKSESSQVPTVDLKPKTTDVIGKPMQIATPADREVFSQNRITVTGRAAKDSLLVIQSPLVEVVQKLTSDEFKIPFDLAVGENVITVSVYPQDKTQSKQQKTIRVYYIDEE
jgi:MFS superfamily sulfate permease-like transporter